MVTESLGVRVGVDKVRVGARVPMRVPELVWWLRSNQVHLAAAVLAELPLPQYLLVLLRMGPRNDLDLLPN